MGFLRHLYKNIFLYILVIGILIVALLSYNRYIVNLDYDVSYEGYCEPETQSCFVGCEDDECSQLYYYTIVQKYAPDLYAQCGTDITDCEEANVCLPEDSNCSITYCDPELDGDSCEYITKKAVQSIPEDVPEETLQEDNELKN